METRVSGTAEEIAEGLLDAGAFLVRPEAPFRLTSGLHAPFYVNCRLILSRPHARAHAAAALAATVPQPGTTVIAGGVTAGVPFATLVAERLGLPLVYVRAEAKAHGTAGRIEGGAVAGARVHLIEDLISTAGSILAFTEALRAGRRAGGRRERAVLARGRCGPAGAGGGGARADCGLRSRHAARRGAQQRAHRRGGARRGPGLPRRPARLVRPSCGIERVRLWRTRDRPRPRPAAPAAPSHRAPRARRRATAPAGGRLP